MYDPNSIDISESIKKEKLSNLKKQQDMEINSEDNNQEKSSRDHNNNNNNSYNDENNKDDIVLSGSSKDFISRIPRLYICIFFIIILTTTTFVLLLKSGDMPYFEDKAYESIEKQVQEQVKKEALSGGLLANERISFAQERYQKLMSSDEVKEAVRNDAEKRKDLFRDSAGNNYLISVDSYYYYKQSIDYLDKGIRPEQNLPYLYIGFYKVMNSINDEFSIERAIFWLPIIFAVLSVILMFLIGLTVSNEYGGFIAGLFLITNSSFILNFRPGFFDTNSFNMLISLAVILTFLLLLRAKKIWIYALALIVELLIFNLIWKGWFYILVIIITASAFILIIPTLRRLKKYWKQTLAIILGSGILLYIFSLTKYPRLILARFRLKEGFFPSGQLTISELQGYPISELISKTGGIVLLIIVFIGIIYILMELFKDNKDHNHVNHILDFIRTNGYYAFSLIYFAMMGIAPLFAKRFTIYFIPAYALLLSVSFNLISPKIAEFTRSLRITKNLHYIFIFFVIILSTTLVIANKESMNSAIRTFPHMNDAIYNTASEIRLNSSNDAIINLWWDYGYLYKAISDRETVFHGSPSGQRVYWISIALLSDNENQSAGILRMMDCSNLTYLFDNVNKQKNKFETIEIIKNISEMNKNQAKKYLKELGLDSNLINSTFCKPPEGFLIIGEELITKAYVLDYYAGFDFNKNSDKSLIEKLTQTQALDTLAEKKNISRKDAEKYYYELLDYDPKKVVLQKIVSERVRCRQDNDILTCSEFIINMTSLDAEYKGDHPVSFIFSNGSYNKKTYDNPGIANTIAVYKQDDKYFMMLVNPKFEDSMLIRLLYLNGDGLTRYRPYHLEEDPMRIATYKLYYE